MTENMFHKRERRHNLINYSYSIEKHLHLQYAVLRKMGGLWAMSWLDYIVIVQSLVDHNYVYCSKFDYICPEIAINSVICLLFKG